MKVRNLLRDQNLFFLDLALVAVSVVGSFLLRLELSQLYFDYLPTIFWMLVVALVVKPLVYNQSGLYRRVWAYASVREMRLILIAVTTASAVMGAIVLTMFHFQVFHFLPRSTILIDWLVSLGMVGGLRFAARLFSDNQTNGKRANGKEKHVLVVGAGDAGALVVRELQRNPQLNLTPVAYLDDDVDKQNHEIHGVPVVGRLEDLGQVIDTQPVSEVIMAIPSAPGSVLRQVADICRRKGTPFRTMPGIYELLGGVVSVNRLREVDITDLLRREPVNIDRQRVGRSLQNKRILITGAGGSIASELCRQIARWGPAEITLVGHGENSIFEILLELKDTFPSLALHPVIADVRDRQRLEVIFERYKPEVVFHAAAHKHVYLMQMNIPEAITNNLSGTRNVIAAACQAGVEKLVMISTDKAVRPSSVMGASKRLAEMIVLDAAQRTGRAFSVVRFGNVLGSRGSVIPLFKRQIAQGGPLTVTHPDIERFFMTIPEAVHLVLQASALGEGGETFILNMGEPVRILNLAEDLIRLSGLEPGKDIEIIFTGMKPGEKLSEVLWDEGAEYQPTDHPDITRLLGEEILSGDTLERQVDTLVQLAQADDSEAIVTQLEEVIPGAAIKRTAPPDLKSIV
ncbi:MAG: polysaccharide biosynthesis protein [Anaerolineales bacterium]|nr:polysaccharide biosynthesis protein [Anaerolineales bacterium]